MRILRFGVMKYGPLTNTGDLRLGKFNVLWGYNERGKTLIIDALLKMILKTPESHFSKVDRVDDSPTGYVVLEHKGKSYSLPDDGHIERILSDVTDRDFRNVFIIRDSDLLLKDRDGYLENLTQRLTGTQIDTINSITKELRRIGNLTDTLRYSNTSSGNKLKDRLDNAKRLVGEIEDILAELEEHNYENLEVEKIKKEIELNNIKKRLIALRDAMNREKYEKGSRIVEELEDVLNEVEKLENYDESDWENWIKIDKEYGTLSADIENKRNDINDLSKNIESQRVHLKKIERNLNELKEREYRASELEKHIQNYNEKTIKYKECHEELEKKKEELYTLESELDDLDSKVRYIEEKDIKNRVERVKNLKKSNPEESGKGNILTYASIVATAAGLISAAGGAILGSVLAILTGSFLGLAGVTLIYIVHYESRSKPENENPEDSWESIVTDLQGILGPDITPENVELRITKITAKRDKLKNQYDKDSGAVSEKEKNCQQIRSEFETIKNNIRELAAMLNLEPTDHFNTYLSETEKIKSERQNAQNEYTKLSTELDQLNNQKNNLENNLKEQEERLAELKSDIGNLKEKYDVESPTQLKEKIEEHENKKNRVSDLAGQLIGIFGSPSNTDIHRRIEYWKEKLYSYETYKDKALGMVYDENEEARLINRENKLIEELKDISVKLNEYRDEFKKIESDAEGILVVAQPDIICSPLGEEDTIVCNSSADIKKIKELLENFLNANENRKDRIVKAIEIFEELEQEESDKIADLFGDNSTAVNYFKKITHGEYKSIRYNTEERVIEVIKRDGTKLTAYQLSGGALDQLYFSIRVSLAERILGSDKGFFILDDPFIKSDPKRIRSAFEVLTELTENGWQILYFSSKGEVKEHVRENYPDVKITEINHVETQRELYGVDVIE